MKKIFGFTLIVLTGACLFWLTLYRNKSVPKPLPPSAVQRPSEAIDEQTNGTDPASKVKPPIAVTNEFVRPADIDREHWDRLMQLRQQLLAQNQPVEFYLRLIDQYGNAVSGATLTGKLSRVDEAMFKTTNFFRRTLGDEVLHEPLELVSDAQGWIRFAGRTGRYVFLTAIHKEGYVSDTSQNIGTLIFEPDGKRRTTVSLEMAAAFDPAKGYTFHLWKKGETERLIPFHFTVPVDLDGTNWYGLDFFRGMVPGGKTGDFRFWFLTTTDANGNPARRFRFEVPDGGLQPDEGPYPYEAPAEGYAQGLDWMYEPYGQHAKGNPPEVLVKRFYVRGRHGRIFATMVWNFTAGSAAQISGFLNPAASRNLEPDLSKQITDPKEIRRLDETTRQ